MATGVLRNRATELFCAWCGPAATVMWLIGWAGLAGLIPPLSPASDAATIQAYYIDHSLGIRAGMWVTMVGAVLQAPFFAVISAHLRRIEGEQSPLAWAQVGIGITSLMLFVVPCYLIAGTAFRDERDPATVLLMNDIAWLPFVGAIHMAVMQILCVGICILANKHQSVFPRWIGYYNLFEAAALFSAAFVLFAKTGPFAWDGIIGFWLTLTAYVSWFFIMFWATRRAILRQDAGDA